MAAAYAEGIARGVPEMKTRRNCGAKSATRPW